MLDPYNPTAPPRTSTSLPRRRNRWQTDPRRCHINWVILDSDWEAEFCRVAETHPRVRAYVKNQISGFEVPYRYGSESAQVSAGLHRAASTTGTARTICFNLIVEIKGYRREDAKEKKPTMETYWVPGVNNLGDVRPLGVRRVHRRLSDRGRLRGEGRGSSSTR